MITAKIVGENVRNLDYQRQDVKRGDPAYRISRSDLVEISENAHKWRAGKVHESTDATEWGSMVDAALSGQFHKTYGILPETYQDEKGAVKPYNANSTICKAAKAGIEASGLIPVKRSDFLAVDAALSILLEDWDFKRVLEDSRKQVLIHGQYTDKATGLEIPLRALLDIEPRSAVMLQAEGGMQFAANTSIIDAKTGRDASKKRWPRYVCEYHCHTQAAFYIDLHNAATGEGRSTFLHLIQESSPPYELGRRILSEQFIQLGRMFYRNALQKYARCLAENKWPGYEEGWSICEPEAWMVEESLGQMGAESSETKSAQVRLMELVTSAGCTFEHFKAFAQTQVDGVEGLFGFQDVQEPMALWFLEKGSHAVTAGCKWAKSSGKAMVVEA